VDVQAIRNYVRLHLEVDDDELPDIILNTYLQDAFDATMAADNRWPRYENTWSVSKVTDATTLTLPADCAPNSIMSVTGQNGYRLVFMNKENMEDLFTPSTMIATGSPIYWSYWGQTMYLAPQPEPSVPYDLVVRGYRQPVWDDAASTIPDLDRRLHLCLAYYAMALSYAAQEDEVLEGVYMARWNRDLAARAKVILEAPSHRPLVLHNGQPIGGVAPYVVNLPPL
jgi:hypothetical protein